MCGSSDSEPRADARSVYLEKFAERVIAKV